MFEHKHIYQDERFRVNNILRLGGIFNKAYFQVATIAEVVLTSETKGIHPLNRSVFSEEDFIAVNVLKSDNGETIFITPTPDIIVTSYLPQREYSFSPPNSFFHIFYKQTSSMHSDPSSPATVSSLPVTTERVSSLPAVGEQITNK